MNDAINTNLTNNSEREEPMTNLIHQKKIRPTKIGTRTIIRGAELERFLNQ